MSKPATVKSQFIRPPIDGLNLISDPSNFQETEARQLDNYYVYDWGIRERASLSTVTTPDGGAVTALFAAANNIGNSLTFISTRNSGGTTKNIYVYDGTNVSLIEASVEFGQAVQFNKHVFLPKLTTAIGRFDLSGGYSTTSFTVATNINGGFAFKNRLYFWDNASTISYGGVESITGATSTVDFGGVFGKGTKIVWGSGWSYNQGLVNDELFVLCNDAGEVLIYSGDYPAAANWQLITRVRVPVPLYGYQAIGSVLRHGQDLLMCTSRGVISLASIVAGQSGIGAKYFNVSAKLRDQICGIQPTINSQLPFAYFIGSTLQDLYVLNYERGAWSKFPALTTGNNLIFAAACNAPGTTSTTAASISSYLLLGVGTTVENGNTGYILKLMETDHTGDSSATYTWKSQFFDFGSNLQKRSNYVRVLGRDMNSATIANTAKVSTEFDDSTVAGSDTRTTTVSDTSYRLQELAPPGVGKRLSYWLTKTGSASAQNEIAGLEVSYEEGGVL